MIIVPAMMSAAATWTTSVAGQPALLWRGQQAVELLPVHPKGRAGHGGAAGVPTAVVRVRNDKKLQHPFADFVQLPCSFCRTCWAWRRRRFRAAGVRGGGAGAARRCRISHETGIILLKCSLPWAAGTCWAWRCRRFSCRPHVRRGRRRC